MQSLHLSYIHSYSTCSFLCTQHSYLNPIRLSAAIVATREFIRTFQANKDFSHPSHESSCPLRRNYAHRILTSDAANPNISSRCTQSTLFDSKHQDARYLDSQGVQLHGGTFEEDIQLQVWDSLRTHAMTGV